jgi:hypothetical protein
MELRNNKREEPNYISWESMIIFLKDLSGAERSLTELKSLAFLMDVLCRKMGTATHEHWAGYGYMNALALLKNLALICNPDKITKIGRLVAPFPIPAERLAAQLNVFPNLIELDLFKPTMGNTGCLYAKEVSTRDMDQYVWELALHCPSLARVSSDWGPSVVYHISRNADTPEITRTFYENTEYFKSGALQL